jgi:hypothetical protein
MSWTTTSPRSLEVAHQPATRLRLRHRFHVLENGHLVPASPPS